MRVVGGRNKHQQNRHGQNSSASVLPTVTAPGSDPVSEPPVARRSKGTRERWVDTWSRYSNLANWPMLLFTALLASAAIYQFVISNKQLAEMRMEQRAWVEMSASPQNLNVVPAQQVHVHLVVENIGKSVAREVNAFVTVEMLPTDRAPVLNSGKSAGISGTTGVLYPGEQLPIDTTMYVTNDAGSEIKTAVLSDEDVQRWQQGRAYFVVRGETTFLDIFGKKHWTHFCTFFMGSAPGVPAASCTAYNGVDGD